MVIKLLTAIAAIFVFLMVILFHDLDIYSCKISRYKVNEFSIGMGPKNITKEKEKQVYQLERLPIGGYVSNGRRR